MKAVARAHPNIALAKYWGKRDTALNLPAVGSLSITLGTLFTQARVEFVRDAAVAGDALIVNGQRITTGQELARASAFLDLVRQNAGLHARAQVETETNFPMGAGLASSAAAFAALAVAASHAAGLSWTPRQLSELARQGSGSAARSIFGGFVEMHLGTRADGSDAVAEPVADAQHWPLQVLVVVTAEGKKSVGSTDGMELTRRTSPFYEGWVAAAAHDVQALRRAILQRDFAAVAAISEHSCLKMHGLMLSAEPPLLYWNSVTVALMHAVYQLRKTGTPAFFTIDAGPQVKVVCLPEAAKYVRATLAEVPGVVRITECGLGPGAYLVQE